LLARERDAVPEALNLVDDRRPERRREAEALLAVLEREAPFPGAPRIGITGPPGSGKSTLLDALVRALRPKGETLAIVAVDPSSRRSGGALLGDRIRVRSAGADPGVFLRSMAARERLGGLADATRASVLVLSAVFDRVFVETVGVGQSEIEVAGLVDTLVFVVAPGSGDTLQFMKAGIMELPDVFAVNKGDLGPQARRTAGELESGLGLTEPADAGWTPPVALLSARDGTGVEELLAAIDTHREHLLQARALASRRRRGRDAFVLEALERRYGSYGVDQLGGRRALADRLAERDDAPSFALLADLGREIEEAIRKPEAP
jgi:LAO/AO transport system kinase